MPSLLALITIVPFDPAIDTPLGHKNLVLIYVIVPLVQLAYGAYALFTWRASGREEDDPVVEELSGKVDGLL